jgi:hypothetical protein
MSWKTILITAGAGGSDVAQFPSFFSSTTMGGYYSTEVLIPQTGVAVVCNMAPSEFYTNAATTEEVNTSFGYGTAMHTNSDGTGVFAQPFKFRENGTWSNCRSSGSYTFSLIQHNQHAGSEASTIYYHDLTPGCGYPISDTQSTKLTAGSHGWYDSSGGSAPDGGTDGINFATWDSNAFDGAVSSTNKYKVMQYNPSSSRRLYIEKVNSSGTTQWAKTFAINGKGVHHELYELSDGTVILIGKEAWYGINSDGTTAFQNTSNGSNCQSKRLRFNPSGTMGAWGRQNVIWIFDTSTGDTWSFDASTMGVSGTGETISNPISYYNNNVIGWDSDGYLWISVNSPSSICKCSVTLSTKAVSCSQRYGLSFDEYHVTGGAIDGEKVIVSGHRNSNTSTQHINNSILCLSTDFSDTLSSGVSSTASSIMPNDYFTSMGTLGDTTMFLSTNTTTTTTTGTAQSSGSTSNFLTNFTGSYDFDTAADASFTTGNISWLATSFSF